MRISSSLLAATISAAIVSATAVQVAVAGRQAYVLPGLIQLGLAVVGAAIVAIVFRRGSNDKLPLGPSIGTIALASLPFLMEPLSHVLFGFGDPIEIQLAYSVRNAMLALALLRPHRHTLHVSCLASLFLVLFSCLWTFNAVVTILLVLYAICGMWWLISADWERLSGRFANHSEWAIPKTPTALVVASTGLLTICLLPLARSAGVTTALNGFFPSSGGIWWHDQDAHGGIGEGDQMVAAKDDATSFGAIESELFLESKMPSLYDVVNETFGEPNKVCRTRHRAIPLTGAPAKENHEETPRTEQAAREFRAIRQPAGRHSKPKTLRSDTLFYVAGRVPLHLKLEVFNTWDGQSLAFAATGTQFRELSLLPANDGNENWVTLGEEFDSVLFPSEERHSLRIINPKTNRVPSPPQLERLHIDRIQSADLFRREADGGIAYDGQFLPQLTVLHVASRPPRQPDLRLAPLQLKDASEPGTVDGGSNEFRQLAREWTQGIPRGWGQIAAIRERLKAEYELDRESTVPEDCEDAAAHFLFSSRRGPEYLFAVSTALLLQELGYSTQVASGFYARPQNFDRLSGLTAVYVHDAHFWVEVQLENKGWLTVETSPGYELLYARLTWTEQIVSSVQAGVRWLSNHAALFLPVLMAVSVGVVFRRKLLRQLVTLVWKWQLTRASSRDMVLWTLWLLEQQTRLQGVARPQGIPIGRWLCTVLGPTCIPGTAANHSFWLASQWALYDGRPTSPFSNDAIRRSCRIVASWQGAGSTI